MDAEEPESLAVLVRVAIDRFGIDPQREPDRTIAIVADLTARPGRSSLPTIAALRSTLHIAAAQSGVITTRRRAECLAEATAAGVESDTAASILDVVLATDPDTEPVPANDPDEPDTPPRRNVRLLGIGVVALVIAVGLLVAILAGSEPSPSAITAATTPAASAAEPTPTAVISEVVTDPARDDEAADTNPPPTDAQSETGVVDETSESAAGATVVIADFAPAQDGGFLVSREWRISDGEITTTIRLENPGDQPIAGLHREFPPPAPGVDLASSVWQPTPTSLIATTAVFGQIVLDPGQTYEITYRATTSVTDPTTQDVLDWYEAWRPQAEGLNAVLGTTAEFTTPEIRNE